MNIIEELIHKVGDEIHKGAEDLDILFHPVKEEKKPDVQSENLAMPEIHTGKVQAREENAGDSEQKTADAQTTSGEPEEETKKPTVSIHSLAMPEIHLKK